MQKDVHGGNIKVIAEKLNLKEIPTISHDFSVNINPFGMPENIEKKLNSLASEQLSNYPEVYAESACIHLAEVHNIPKECVLVGNGSTEIFSLLLHTFRPSKVHCIEPCYSGYAEVCHAAGLPYKTAISTTKEEDFRVNLEDIDFSDIEMIFLGSPNNPSGITIPRDSILDSAEKHPDTFFVIDESFIDFLSDTAEKSLCEIRSLPKNIAVVKSLTKFFALAGIRLGMIYANASVIAKIAEKRLPWSVNILAQTAAQLVYADTDYICETRKNICELRSKMYKQLSEIKNIRVFPGEADFLLCELIDSDVCELQKKLLKESILIRSCADVPGLGASFFRIAVRDEKANQLLLNILRGQVTIKNKSHAIMIVGTTSGAGKSIITAAYCRYFARQGIRVAPFKAQNMSLNSFVTKEGGEMGRAQVVQAMAAGIEPHTDMNPVLLKPTKDAASQLIVNGKVAGNFAARDYYEQKRCVREDAHAAFDRLSEQYDMIILEGAGSPTEINLMKEDFVNMSMAEYADARTILVADINPGGVFASIYGTIKLLPEKYRKLICGVIINKFRGDVSLLQPGIKEIEELTGIPVLGVMPYLKDLNIEEEDSMGLDDKIRSAAALQSSTTNNQCQLLDIAVISLPRMSNYTDFLALETSAGVQLRYVSHPDKLGSPDLIILPGTKITVSDMCFLQESGFETRLKQCRSQGIMIIGICGGYQMLGEEITDPHCIEGKNTEVKGLGFLACTTEITINVPFAKKRTAFSGYEIHMGITKKQLNNSVTEPLKILSRSAHRCDQNCGMLSEDGRVFGCYIHGFFDKYELRTQLLNYLAEEKEIALPEQHNKTVNSAESFNHLADMLEKYVNQSTICDINMLES